ncbi:MAG: response regulator [Rhizomicrobium sp.]
MSGESERIVYVVDDDEAVRDSTLALLESEDIVGRAYALARDFLAEFDAARAGCLIFDVHMPEMSGIELLMLLRARGVATPAIILTGRGDAALDVAARQGNAAMLPKPPDDDKFMELVKAALRKPRLA